MSIEDDSWKVQDNLLLIYIYSEICDEMYFFNTFYKQCLWAIIQKIFLNFL